MVRSGFPRKPNPFGQAVQERSPLRMSVALVVRPAIPLHKKVG